MVCPPGGSILKRPVFSTDLVETSAIPGGSACPTTPTEMALTEVLAGVMQVDDVAVESHFFDDLGADSMVMAQFCARIRKRSDLPSVSMKDVYRHPTIKDLAAAFAGSSLAPPAESPPADKLPEPASTGSDVVSRHGLLFQAATPPCSSAIQSGGTFVVSKVITTFDLHSVSMEPGDRPGPDPAKPLRQARHTHRRVMLMPWEIEPLDWFVQEYRWALPQSWGRPPGWSQMSTRQHHQCYRRSDDQPNRPNDHGQTLRPGTSPTVAVAPRPRRAHHTGSPRAVEDEAG